MGLNVLTLYCLIKRIFVLVFQHLNVLTISSLIITYLFCSLTIKGAMEDLQDDVWEEIQDIPNFVTPYPILAPDDLDHNEAQKILKAKDRRLKSTGVDTFTYERPSREGLEGPPLSLEQCKNLVLDGFVRT